MAKTTKTTWLLKAWRTHRGLTQEQLAEATGLSKPYISQLERGSRQYTQELLEKFSEALNCLPADLISRDPTAKTTAWDVLQRMTPTEQAQVIEIAQAMRRAGSE